MLAPRLTPQGQLSLLGKLTTFTTTNSIDNTMRTTAMRAILLSFEMAESQGLLPATTSNAYLAVHKILVPYIVDTALKKSPSSFDNNVLDVVVDLVRIFGPRIPETDKSVIQKSLLLIVYNASMASVTRKKAITALSTLANELPDRLLGPLVSKSIDAIRHADCSLSRRRLLLTLFGSLVKSIPRRIIPYTKTIVPLILEPLSEQAYQASLDQLVETGSPDEEAEEVFEAALTAMECFLSSSGKEIDQFVDISIDVALRFVKYDPNVAEDNADDTEISDPQEIDMQVDDADDLDADDDQDFEEEGNESDDDDSSWKVRRCAIKVLQALIEKRGTADLMESPVLFQKVALALIKRFSEREETVRIEVIGTLSQLVRQTETSQTQSPNGVGLVESQPTLPSRSRKRRRDSNGPNVSINQSTKSMDPGSDSPALSPLPSVGARAELAHLTPKLTRFAQASLKQRQPSTKLAVMSLLKDLVRMQPGALTETLNQFMDSLAEALQPSSTSVHMSSLSTNAHAGGSLRIETLRLLALVCDNHSSIAIAQSMESLIPHVVLAAKDRMSRVAVEAIRTLEAIIKAFTPPRSAGVEQSHHHSINIIFDAVFALARQADADLETRQQAIIALGVILARTSGQQNAKALADGKKSSALAVISDRLRNETTRIAAIQAIDTLAQSVNDRQEIQDAWIGEILIELLGQLRKADRSLRDNSLLAIKAVASNDTLFGRLDESTARSMTEALLPLINADELSSLGTALIIYAKLATINAKIVSNDQVVCQLTMLIKRSLNGATLDALAMMLKAIGERGSGKAFMQSFLQQGVKGDTVVTGRAIGTLLVYGGRNVGVSVDDFAKELDSTDETRVCLALSVLGEAGLLFGSSPPSTLQPKLLMKYLKSRSDQIARAAAIALGRAGVGNKDLYLPAILQLAGDEEDMKYSALHALREILTSASRHELDLSANADSIWDALMTASWPEDNQVLGAECFGRLALADPATHLLQLQVSSGISYHVHPDH